MTGQSARRGAAGGIIMLVLLMGVAVMLYMYFGGEKSYMENVVEGKKKGEQVALDVVAYSLVQTITAARTMDPDAAPKTTEELDLPASTFKDPWDNPIRWTYDDPDRPTTVTITSDGPDGEPDTEDDVHIEKRLPF